MFDSAWLPSPHSMCLKGKHQLWADVWSFLFGAQALSKAMLEFRAQMTSQAEQQIIANAAQKEEALNVQQIVDKQTKELKVRALTGSALTEAQECSAGSPLAFKRVEGTVRELRSFPKQS